MRNNHILAYGPLALIMLLGTTFVSAETLTPAVLQHRQDHAKWKAREDENEKHFPTVEFNEPAPTDPLKRTQREQKQKRKNGLGLVSPKIQPNIDGAALLPENQFDFPGLPVEQSPVIVIADVLQSEAHLSEDKTNVYSEFTVRIVEVIKASTSLPGSEMIVERLGGYVRYPDGQKVLYRVGTGRVPRVGARYLFFLKPSPELDYSILTAYEFGDKAITALDPSSQFEKYDGYALEAFRNLVVEAVNKSH